MVVLRSPLPAKRSAIAGSPRRQVWGWLKGLAALGAIASGPLLGAAQAGPVLCTTTLEAPLLKGGEPLPAGKGPTEVTRCGVVGTVPELVERRYFSWRAPFARGVDITHQITDFFGLAMGGGDGTRLMGLGFPDQAIIWDGSAIENTTTFLMDQQVHLVPRRTADLPSPYTTSVGSGGRGPGGGESMPLAYPSTGMEPR
ncbi:MAG: hypothetical protein RLZZ609_1073 [Cyanobacteriota bacterium]|jgi:hypothetical protein